MKKISIIFLIIMLIGGIMIGITTILSTEVSINDSVVSDLSLLAIVFTFVMFLFIIGIVVFPNVNKTEGPMSEMYYPEFVNKVKEYNIPGEFEKLYNELNNKNEAVLSVLAKEVKTRKIVLTVFGLVILTAIISFLLNMNKNLGIAIILILGVISLLYAINTKTITKKGPIYKKQLYNEFIKIMNYKLIYEEVLNQNSEIENWYNEAEFGDQMCVGLTGDDYIEGYIDENVFIKMADIETFKFGYRKRRLLFKGLFSITDCNKNIGTYIKVTNNTKYSLQNMESITITGQELQNNFAIYGKNKILAEQIFNQDIMQIIKDFYNEHGIIFEIVIKNDKIYLRFYTGETFASEILGTVMEKHELYRYSCILEFISTITEKINKVIYEIDV